MFLKLRALSTSSAVKTVRFECRMHLIASCQAKNFELLSYNTTTQTPRQFQIIYDGTNLSYFDIIPPSNPS